MKTNLIQSTYEAVLSDDEVANINQGKLGSIENFANRFQSMYHSVYRKNIYVNSVSFVDGGKCRVVYDVVNK